MTDITARTAETTWKRIRIRIRYEPNGLWSREGVAILTITSIMPKGASLPISESGYRCLFCAPRVVEAKGGPIQFALAWLGGEAGLPPLPFTAMRAA